MTIKTKLDFLILSPPKTCTTSLAYTILKHPDIERYGQETLDSLEPRLFTKRDIKSNDIFEYNNKFSNDNRLKFEKSTCYFSCGECLQRIKLYCKSNIKLIILVRNPVYRFISQYIHFRAISLLSNNIPAQEKAGDAMSKTMRSYKTIFMKLMNDPYYKTFPEIDKLIYGQDYSLLSPGLYAQHLDKIYQNFNSDNIYIVLSDDYVLKRDQILNNIAKLLDIDSEPLIKTKHIYYNRGNDWIRYCMEGGLDSPLKSIDENHLSALQDYYHDSNLQLISRYGIHNQWNEKIDINDIYSHWTNS